MLCHQNELWCWAIFRAFASQLWIVTVISRDGAPNTELLFAPITVLEGMKNTLGVYIVQFLNATLT